jgi:hypothetical protein
VRKRDGSKIKPRGVTWVVGDIIQKDAKGKPGIVAHAYNPNTQEVEAGESRLKAAPLSYIQNKKKKEDVEG